jgi:hypothetical protein
MTYPHARQDHQGDDSSTQFTGLFLPDTLEEDQHKRVIAEVIALGLERNAWELDVQGYTVVSPELVDGGDLASRLREKLLDLTEAETGSRPDLADGQNIAAGPTPIGRGHFLINPLYSDRVFEEALMNRSVLALITYLLGESCILSSSSALLKVRAAENLELHSDQVGQPAPLPPYAQVANAHWLLTDYSTENGATRFVPGSHKLCRHPTRAEAVDLSNTVTISAPAGSVLIWHGNTWHGAAERTSPGARMTLIHFFSRWYLMPQMLLRQSVPSELLERNPERFAVLMGKRSPYSSADGDGTPVDFTLGQGNQFA